MLQLYQCLTPIAYTGLRLNFFSSDTSTQDQLKLIDRSRKEEKKILPHKMNCYRSHVSRCDECHWLRTDLFLEMKSFLLLSGSFPPMSNCQDGIYINRKYLLSLCSVCGYLEPFAWLLLMLKLEISAGTTKYISNGKTKVLILNSIFLQFQGEHKLLLKLIHRIRCTVLCLTWLI